MHRKLVIAVAALSIVALATWDTQADGRRGRRGKISVVSPFAQLTADWWRWAIDAEVDPIDDLTGEVCDIDQPEGNVWFLAGTHGGTAERTCTIPEGKHLFFPLLNAWVCCGFLDNPDTPDIDESETPGDLRDQVAEFMEPELISQLELTVDGRLIRNALDKGRGPADLLGFRAYSNVFQIDTFDEFIEMYGLVPEQNEFVSDGYWVLLPPLSEGEHVIHFSGVRDAFVHSLWGPMDEFSLDVTYQLTIGDD